MEYKFYNPYLITGIIALSGFHLGMETSSMTSFLSSKQFLSQFGVLNLFEQSMLGAGNSMGAVVGSSLSGMLCEKIGCVWSIRISCLPWITGTIVGTLSPNIQLVVISRVLKGLTIGMVSSIIPVYINETLPDNRKGFAISIVQFCSASGTLVIYYVGYYLQIHVMNNWSFKIAWLVEVSPTILLFVSSWFLPNSPHWYATKSEWLNAAITLDKLSGATPEQNEKRKFLGDKFFVLSAYTLDSEDAIKSSFSDLFSKKYYIYTVVGVVTQSLVQVSSVGILMYFFIFICEVCGMKSENRIWFVSMQYFILAIFNLLPAFYMDSCRRKDVLCYGYSLLGVSFTCIWAVVHIYQESVPRELLLPNSPLDWEIKGVPASLVLAIFLFLIAVYSSLIQGFSWIYVSEIFPINIKSKGASICMSASWALNMILTLLAPMAFRSMKHWLFGFLALTSFTSVGLIMSFPETKCLPRPINELFENTTNIKAETEKHINSEKKRSSSLPKAYSIKAENLGDKLIDKRISVNMDDNSNNETNYMGEPFYSNGMDISGCSSYGTHKLESSRESKIQDLSSSSKKEDDEIKLKLCKTQSQSTSLSTTSSIESKSFYSNDWNSQHRSPNIKDHLKKFLNSNSGFKKEKIDYEFKVTADTSSPIAPSSLSDPNLYKRVDTTSPDAVIAFKSKPRSRFGSNRNIMSTNPMI